MTKLGFSFCTFLTFFFNSFFTPRNLVISGKHNCSRCYQERSKSSFGGEICLLFWGEILWTNITYKYKWVNDVLQWRDLWTSCHMYKASFHYNLIFVVCFYSLQVLNPFRKDCSCTSWFKCNSTSTCSQSLNLVLIVQCVMVYGKCSSSHCNVNSSPGHIIKCHCFKNQGSVALCGNSEMG